MSLHIKYSYQCKKCSADYIPYDKTVACPMCGAIGDETYPFIPEAAASARFNLETTGSYQLDAWYIGSFADQVLSLLFYVLDSYRILGKPFEQRAREAIDEIDLGSDGYLREHLYQIALKVKTELDASELKDLSLN